MKLLLLAKSKLDRWKNSHQSRSITDERTWPDVQATLCLLFSSSSLCWPISSSFTSISNFFLLLRWVL